MMSSSGGSVIDLDADLDLMPECDEALELILSAVISKMRSIKSLLYHAQQKTDVFIKWHDEVASDADRALLKRMSADIVLFLFGDAIINERQLDAEFAKIHFSRTPMLNQFSSLQDIVIRKPDEDREFVSIDDADRKVRQSFAWKRAILELYLYDDAVKLRQILAQNYFLIASLDETIDDLFPLHDSFLRLLKSNMPIVDDDLTDWVIFKSRKIVEYDARLAEEESKKRFTLFSQTTGAKSNYYQTLQFIDKNEYEKALELLLVPREKIHSLSMIQLGEMVRHGRGCKVDRNAALVFFILALLSTEHDHVKKNVMQLLCDVYREHLSNLDVKSDGDASAIDLKILSLSDRYKDFRPYILKSDVPKKCCDLSRLFTSLYRVQHESRQNIAVLDPFIILACQAFEAAYKDAKLALSAAEVIYNHALAMREQTFDGGFPSSDYYDLYQAQKQKIKEAEFAMNKSTKALRSLKAEIVAELDSIYPLVVADGNLDDMIMLEHVCQMLDFVPREMEKRSVSRVI